MKRIALGIGTALVLLALMGCVTSNEKKPQPEVKRKEEVQHRAGTKSRVKAKDRTGAKERAKEKHITANERRKEEMRRKEGESAVEWYSRVKQSIRSERDAAIKNSLTKANGKHAAKRRDGKRDEARKHYDEEMQTFSKMFVSELKREALRKPGEDFNKYEARVKNLLPEYHTGSGIPEYIFVEAKKVVKEEFYAEKNRGRKQNAEELLLQTEKELMDPAFKYPYANQIAGVELYGEYLSGFSCKWFATSKFLPYIRTVAKGDSVYNGDLAADLTKAKQTVREAILYNNASFYFDKRYGTLHSVSFNISGTPEAVAKKIEDYKKKYPGLKHNRKTQRDGRNFSEFPVSYKCEWNICTDTLEADRMKIVIVSQSLIGLENFVILSDQLSDLQKKEVKNMHKKVMRDGLEKNAVVTITDKVLKEYFSALKDAPTAK